MAESDDEKDLEELVRIKERSLVGSLTNAYAFKDGGLVKRVSSPLATHSLSVKADSLCRLLILRPSPCSSTGGRNISSRTTRSRTACLTAFGRPRRCPNLRTLRSTTNWYVSRMSFHRTQQMADLRLGSLSFDSWPSSSSGSRP